MTSDSALREPAPELLHGCVRCGAPVPLSEGMCERCNPLGLKGPAASQAHATVVLAIGAAVVFLAFAAHLALVNVGPFDSRVTDVQAAPTGLRVTIAITNTGSAAGRTTCRVMDPTIRGIGPEAAYVESPMVAAGSTATFDAVVVTLGTAPKPLSVSCGT